jgi:hypothetical protein
MPNDELPSIHFGFAATEAGDEAKFYVHVTTKEELTRALREGTAPIVIKNEKLARLFEWLLWARELRWWYFGTLVALLIAYAISQQYSVKLGLWGIGRQGGEIVLNPQKPSSPPSSTGEE